MSVSENKCTRSAVLKHRQISTNMSHACETHELTSRSSPLDLLRTVLSSGTQQCVPRQLQQRAGPTAATACPQQAPPSSPPHTVWVTVWVSMWISVCAGVKAVKRRKEKYKA
jgi:hypothetical protein